MQKQWFGIFNIRKKEKAVNLLFSIFCFAVSVIAYSEGEFASLPEVEIQYHTSQSPGAVLSVGDAIDLVVPDTLEVNELNVPAGSSSLKDLGWRLNKTAEGKFKAYALRSGDMILPSLEIKNKQGIGIGRTQPLKFKVDSAISAQDPKPKEPEALREPLALPFPTLVAVLVGLLILLALAGFVYFVTRFLRSRESDSQKVEPVIAKESEDQIALGALLNLEKQDWYGAGRNKILVFSISEIFKKYLSARYSFEASESTSEEILNIAEARRFFSAEILDELEKIFSELDGIKFTDIAAETARCVEILQNVRKFILKTRRSVHEIR